MANITFRDTLLLGRTVVAVARDRQLSVLAAGLAYHVFNCFLPAVLLAVVGLSASGQFEAAVLTVAAIVGVDAGTVVEVVRAQTTTEAGRLRVAGIAGVIFLWSTARLFQSVQSSFRDLYGGGHEASPLRTVLDIGLAFATFVLAVIVLPVLAVFVESVVANPTWQLLAPGVLLVTLFVSFLPIYYRFPDAQVTVREAVPGAAFAALGWTLSAVGFRVYATASQSVELYGVIGGLLLLLTWLYLSGFVLLLGVIVNAVAARRVTVELG